MCVPAKVVTDGAGELTGAAWKEKLHLFHTTDDVTEADHQNQNFAERNIQTVKHMMHKVLDQCGAPSKLWCFAVDYTTDIWNHLANRALEWRTPIEKLNGRTPDISKFKLFGFYDPIKYLDSDVKFPDSRFLTGKFLGF